MTTLHSAITILSQRFAVARRGVFSLFVKNFQRGASMGSDEEPPSRSRPPDVADDVVQMAEDAAYLDPAPKNSAAVLGEPPAEPAPWSTPPFDPSDGFPAGTSSTVL